MQTEWDKEIMNGSIHQTIFFTIMALLIWSPNIHGWGRKNTLSYSVTVGSIAKLLLKHLEPTNNFCVHLL
jgi:hypothetical protein